jgi:hypothetical protein
MSEAVLADSAPEPIGLVASLAVKRGLTPAGLQGAAHPFLNFP